MRFRETTMALAAGLLWAFCLPGGAAAGGSATETDPRFGQKQNRLGG
jgi:hypothetical protein